MIKLIDSNGNVLLTREIPKTKRAKMSSVRTRRIAQGMKKTIRPTLMSKEEFFKTVVKNSNNGDI